MPEVCEMANVVVNAFSRALGVSVTWRCTDPYGFIKPAVLVGFKGLCNNPFFGDNEAKKKVDDESKVAIVLGKNTPLASLDTNFTSPIDPKTKEAGLAYVSRTPVEGTFRAEKPGKATVEVEVMDRKTLLSPPLSITVDVLPAR